MSFIFKSNRPEVEAAVDLAVSRGLEICGGKAESYAKRNCPVKTGRLKNSITHEMEDSKTEVVGSNVWYAPYQELGTHRVTPKKFIRNAVEGHTDEYKRIIENELKKAGA